MDKVQALHNFWSSFGIKAYDESTVPDEVNMLLKSNNENEPVTPYITYEVNIGDYGDDVASAVSVWYYDSTWKKIEQKISEIDERLKNGGVTVNYDGGNIWIKKSTPYLTRVTESNDMIRRYLVNTLVEYH